MLLLSIKEVSERALIKRIPAIILNEKDKFYLKKNGKFVRVSTKFGETFISNIYHGTEKVRKVVGNRVHEFYI